MVVLAAAGVLERHRQQVAQELLVKVITVV